MIIKAHRITKLLEPLGFHFWYEHEYFGDIRYSRPSSVDGLFEHIRISAYGDRHRTLTSRSLVSITSGPVVNHEFSVDRIHWQLCSVPDRCFTEISTAKEAIAWEMALADFVDQDLRS